MSLPAPHALRKERTFAPKGILSDAQTLTEESVRLSPPLTARPWFFPALIVVMVAACSLLIGGILFVSRRSVPTAAQMKLAAWERACTLGTEPDSSLLTPMADEISYRGSMPGRGKFRAAYELDTAGAVTVADLMIVVDRPQWGCLDFGLRRREPVTWARMVLAGGKIEAYALLPARAERLTPDTPLYVLYCYPPDGDYPLREVGPWRGFSAVAAYQGCRYGGTATPY